MEDQNGSAQTDPMDDVASAFLEEDSEDSVDARDPDPDNAAVDGDDADEDEDGDDAEEGEPEEESGRYKVTVKNESGEVVEKQVTLDELKAGFARHEDVEVAKRSYETQSRSLHQEASQYVQKVEQAKEAKLGEFATLMSQALQVTSPADMMGLAQSDPQAYAQAMARQQVLQSIQGQIQAEQQQSALQRQHLTEQQTMQRVEAAKSELARSGITTAQVQKTYEQAIKSYGYTAEELGSNLDHKLVLVLKDAAAFRALKDKEPQVAKKLREAPKLPPSKLQSARRVDTKRQQRFASGRASVDDLAAFFTE